MGAILHAVGPTEGCKVFKRKIIASMEDTIWTTTTTARKVVFMLRSHFPPRSGK